MADLRHFAGRIRMRAKAVADNSDALVRKVAIAVDTAVVMSTPVDKGRARSNWQVELGFAPTGTIEAYVPGEEGSTGGPNAQAAMDQCQKAVAQYKGGETIHIVNNLPYIEPLNNGTSDQAPAGFIETAVVVGVAAAQGAGSLLQEALKDNL